MRTIAQLLDKGLSSTLGYKPDPRHRISADSKCPDCGRPIKIVFDAKVVGTFAALMSLDQMVVCNDCADFRTALREAQETVQRLIDMLRLRGKSITAKTQVKFEVQGEIDKLNAEFRPLMDAVLQRIVRILARRTGKQQADHKAWSTQFLNIWECLRTYAGEELVRVEHEDNTWRKLKAVRLSYGVVIKHHGKPKELPPARPKVIAPPVVEMPEP